jgi:signal peptidase II
MMKKTYKIIWYVILAHIVCIVDRITKHIAMQIDGTVESRIPLLSWSYVKNRGISWGMFYSYSSVSFILMTSIVCAVIVALAVYTYKRFQENYSIVGEVLVLSGAMSNLVDRIWYAGVIDFIVVSYHDWYFPVFNVADIAIVVGVGIMVLNLWRQDA